MSKEEKHLQTRIRIFEDMVQIVNEYGIEGKARVTEFIRSQSKEGLDSYPTFVTVE